MSIMSGDNIAQMAYLGLLGAAILGLYLAHNRESLGRVVQQAVVWALIFIGAIAAAGLWSDIRRDVTPAQAMLSDGRIEVPVSRDGHFRLTLQVNDVPVDFVVDTGASQMVLTRTDAERAGIDLSRLSYVGRAQTANGSVGTANVWLDEVSLDGWTERDVRAVVSEGELFHSLLGMDYLSRMARIEIVDGRLILTP